MKKLKILLALITQDNDYQREQASVAEKTAQRLGIDLQVLYANGDAIAQTQQILTSLRSPIEVRPDAVVVEPVGTGMLGVAKAAADSGIGWVALNRLAESLAPLRLTSTAPMGSVDCDNVEVGRIQGRQFGALLPSGGSVLYLEGASTDVSKQRRAGVAETVPANVDVKTVRGKWTEDSGFQAITSWLRVQSSQTPDIGIIGCQNDAMAMGARKAVEQLTDARLRELWLKVPFTGCDGVRETGLVWIQKGLLTATVVTPALSGVAIEMLAKAIATGTQLPERTMMKPTSYPSIQELSAKAAARPAG